MSFKRTWPIKTPSNGLSSCQKSFPKLPQPSTSLVYRNGRSLHRSLHSLQLLARVLVHVRLAARGRRFELCGKVHANLLRDGGNSSRSVLWLMGFCCDPKKESNLISNLDSRPIEKSSLTFFLYFLLIFFKGGVSTPTESSRLEPRRRQHRRHAPGALRRSHLQRREALSVGTLRRLAALGRSRLVGAW